MEDNHEHKEKTSEGHQKIRSKETTMGSISGNGIGEHRDQPQEQRVGDTEDIARLRLMEISKAVPPADEADLNEEEYFHPQVPKNATTSSSPASTASLSSPRPDTEDEIRRKLMSISYSFDQPLSNPSQPVAG
ncbi:unnamed protein product [Calypogeia fissa]